VTNSSSSSSSSHQVYSRDMYGGGLPLLDVGSSAAAAAAAAAAGGVGGGASGYGAGGRPRSAAKGGEVMGEVPGSPLDDLLTRVTDLIQEFDTALGRR
jgi:hypothetical protein